MCKDGFPKLFLSFLMAMVLSGCSAATPDVRVLWPPPPQTPKMEFIGAYYSEAHLHDTKRGRMVSSMLGDDQALAFDFPFGIASNSKDLVYVTDSGGKRIYVVDFNRKKITELGKSPVGSPMGITIDDGGRIYVVVPETKNVLVYSDNHTPMFNFGSEVLKKPSKIAIDENRKRIYVSDLGDNSVKSFDFEGKHLFSFGEPGSDVGKLWKPTGLVVDEEGNIYVAEGLNARISVFDSAGKHLKSFGERMNNVGGFEIPKDIAMDSEGNLHILDTRKAGILTYSKEGELLLYTGFGKPTNNALGFGSPTSIFIDARDRIFVADMLNKRFSVWQFMNETYLKENPVTESERQAYRNVEAR